MKKYCMTAERILSMGIEFEAENDESARIKAAEIFGALQLEPQEFEGCGEVFDFALDDVAGKTIVDWEQ